MPYRAGRDTVWCLGDLVNRGSGSLDVLRWAVGEGAQAVLGNHDAYCLAAYADVIPRRDDTLNALFDANDCADLMGWLRARPVVHCAGGSVFVHAGIHPEWTLKGALKRAKKIEKRLANDAWEVFLRRVFTSRTSKKGPARDFNVFTRIRMVDESHQPVFTFSGPPENAPDGLRPWYVRSAIADEDVKIFFGHWAALDHRRLPMGISMDGGCVWGRRLFGHCIDTEETWSVPAHRKDLL